MNILINLPTAKRGDILVFFLLKWKNLQKRGCRLFVNNSVFIRELPVIEDVYKFEYLTDKEKNILDFNLKNKFSVMFYALKQNIRSLWLLNEMKNPKYDLVYSPSSVLDLVIIPFVLKMINKKTKWVTVIDNIVPITDPGNKIIRFLAWIFFRLSIVLIKRADIVFVSTPEIYNYILKNGFNVKRLKITNFAVEADLINKSLPDSSFNIDALFIGRINETKGIYDMLKVLDHIKIKYPKFQLAIMGEGDETTKKQFKEKIKEMCLEKNIQFLGFRKGVEKFNIIKSSKCFWFLSVSKSESFGIALLEAVCCGIPAFTYDLEQFSRVYKNDEINVSLKGDWKCVAEKIIKLFDSGSFINDNGRILKGKYSWSEVAKVEYDTMKEINPKRLQ